MLDTPRHDPRPPIKDLRWHSCVPGDPWTESMGKRATHPEATEAEIGVMRCPVCGITFPST